MAGGNLLMGGSEFELPKILLEWYQKQGLLQSAICNWTTKWKYSERNEVNHSETLVPNSKQN
jgi:hypothetical protein